MTEAVKCKENENWRDNLKTIAEMNKYMFEHQIRVDCTFRVGSDPDKTQVFHSHKFVLARSSCVFDAMFYGSLPEEKEIRVTDVEPSVFALLLNYIYTFEVHLDNVKDAVDLALAANKYMLKSLTSKCVAFMCHNVDVTNVLRCLEMLSILDTEVLDESACVKVIQKHTRMLIHSEHFESTSESTLVLLLDQDILSCHEYELVKAAVNWARKQSVADENIRIYLEKNIIPRLRFLTMTQSEFELVIGETNWLSDEEKKFIVDGINNRPTVNVPLLCTNRIRRKYYEESPAGIENIPVIIPSNNMIENVFKRKSIPGIKSQIHINGNDMYILGVRILSQVKSNILTSHYPEVFNNRSESYEEKIKINLNSLVIKERGRFDNHLYTVQDQILDFTYVNARVPYNSVINIMFDHPVKLIKNKSYGLYMHCYNSAGFYPISGLNNHLDGLSDLFIHKYRLEHEFFYGQIIDNLLVSAIMVQSVQDFEKSLGNN